MVDKLYTPDNIVVLWLLYPYRIIPLGSNKHNGDDAPWSLYDDWTVWSVATTSESLSKASYCNKDWHKETEELKDIKLDQTNDSNITQAVQENVALTYEGTRNQALKNF